MRLSCNGCRVLRKGCSESCSIRPCLQWIKSPDAQSNATVFLAKFYGRAGLLNLVNAAPENLRSAVFRSLLYEACGRIVNPIYGSVGLLWSGKWSMCQAAVEAVLKGAPIVQISTQEQHTLEPDPDDKQAASLPLPVSSSLHKNKAAYDIRHVAAASSSSSSSSSSSFSNKQLPLPKEVPKEAPADADNKPGRRLMMKKKRTSPSSAATATTCNNKKPKQQQQQTSSQTQHHQDPAVSMDSDEAAGSHVTHAEDNVSQAEQQAEEEQPMGLDLTLGFAPVPSPCLPRQAAGDAAGYSSHTHTGTLETGTGCTAGEPAFRFL